MKVDLQGIIKLLDYLTEFCNNVPIDEEECSACPNCPFYNKVENKCNISVALGEENAPCNW
jgi:hypothetical protein